ncbi:MAG: SdiA-regulated family protein [Flavisolibacter sp.]|nr:SdiA-regulated family protein [Flavisolibacter sp.]
MYRVVNLQAGILYISIFDIMRISCVPFLLFLLLIQLHCTSKTQNKKSDTTKEESSATDETDTQEKSSKQEKTATIAFAYDLSHPEIIELPKRLKEISGLAYASDSSLYAIEDEDGLLYNFSLKDKQLKQWRFGKKGDYEDLVLLKNQVFVLRSDGHIFYFPFPPTDNIKAEKWKIAEDKSEFESLYADPSTGKLMMLCKHCNDDKKDKISAWSIDPATGEAKAGALILHGKKLTEQKERIKPSAAAVHPLTKELYVVASVNNLLIRAEEDGAVKEVYPLDPKLFKQPEGIAFTPNGDMIISNEAHNEGPANLLVFRYHSQ